MTTGDYTVVFECLADTSARPLAIVTGRGEAGLAEAARHAGVIEKPLREGGWQVADAGPRDQSEHSRCVWYNPEVGGQWVSVTVRVLDVVDPTMLFVADAGGRVRTRKRRTKAH